MAVLSSASSFQLPASSSQLRASWPTTGSNQQGENRTRGDGIATFTPLVVNPSIVRAGSGKLGAVRARCAHRNRVSAQMMEKLGFLLGVQPGWPGHLESGIARSETLGHNGSCSSSRLSPREPHGHEHQTARAGPVSREVRGPLVAAAVGVPVIRRGPAAARSRRAQRAPEEHGVPAAVHARTLRDDRKGRREPVSIPPPSVQTAAVPPRATRRRAPTISSPRRSRPACSAPPRRRGSSSSRSTTGTTRRPPSATPTCSCVRRSIWSSSSRPTSTSRRSSRRSTAKRTSRSSRSKCRIPAPRISARTTTRRG